MHPGFVRDVLTLVLGVLTGVLSGAFGVGGAVLSTPGIRVLGASALVAVGTTLPAILPSAAAGTARYAREGLVHWGTVATTAPLGVAAAVAGSLASHAVPGHGHWLMVLTAALLGLTAVRLGRRNDEGGKTDRSGESSSGPSRSSADSFGPSRSWGEPSGPSRSSGESSGPSGPSRSSGESSGESSGRSSGPSRSSRSSSSGPSRSWGEQSGRRSFWLRSAVGAGAGALSGLLGVGGGAILLPGFLEVLRLPTKQAVATSLACVGILALPSTVTHAFLGDIDWRFAVLLGVAVVPGARLGAALAIRAGDRRLRLAVAVVLGALAVVYGAGELRAALG